MKNEPGTTHVTPVGGNIFADLGFEGDEAVAFLLESRREIARKMGAALRPENPSVEELQLSPRTASILRTNGIDTLKTLCCQSFPDLMRIPGIGRRRGMEILKAAVLGGGGLMPPYAPELFEDHGAGFRGYST